MKTSMRTSRAQIGGHWGALGGEAGVFRTSLSCPNPEANLDACTIPRRPFIQLVD